MQIQRILALVALAFLAGNLHAVQVTNTIDSFTTSQILSTNNSTLSSTVESAGAIGGFRTMSLTTAGGDPPETPPNTSISVSSSNNLFSLSTPAAATSSFELKWGGAGGTSGLGVDFGAGQELDLTTSLLSFSLRSSDQPSSFTWQFIDSFNNTATYTDVFPITSSSSPLAYTIYLSSFSNANAVKWNSINYIVFSAGGLEVDMTIPAPLQVVASTVPEPGTWVLVITGLAVLLFATHRRLRSNR